MHCTNTYVQADDRPARTIAIAMFASLFGRRNKAAKNAAKDGTRGGGGGAGDDQDTDAYADAAGGPDGGYGHGSGAHANGNSAAAAAHAETLEAVIATQQRRCHHCQRSAEKAEERRDALLAEAESAAAGGAAEDAAELNDRAREQENLRKSKTDLCIALQAQIGVLERVLAESGFAKQDLDEDPEVAAARQAAEESQLYASREHVRAQQEQAEEMSYMLAQGLRDPMDPTDPILEHPSTPEPNFDADNIVAV